MIYALRAAITVKENTELAIGEAINELWQSFIKLNNFTQEDLISVMVSATDDITKAYPASFIRKAGYDQVALLDLAQLKVENEIPLCIRLIVYTKKPGRNLYLRDAAKLRPEWGVDQMNVDIIKTNDIIHPRQALNAIKPYVAGKPIDEVKRELGLDEVIKLASNENPHGPSNRAIKVMEKNLSKVFLYPDAQSFELKKALSDFYKIKDSEIIVGNGSDEVIKLISETYLNPTDNIVQADITFSEYEFGARVMGASVIKVPLKNFTHDLDGFLDNIDENTKICYICNPNNPTGTILEFDRILDFLRKIPRGVLVVLDEAYAEYVENQGSQREYCLKSLALINEFPVIILRTFSKIYGLAGLRVGYGIANKEIIKDIQKTREPFNVNSLAQAAAIEALLDDEHREYSYNENLFAKTNFYQECEKRSIEYVESQTNFVLLRVDNANKVFQAMLQKGIIIRSGSSFGLDNHIRVTLGTREEMEKFWQIFDEVV